MLVRIYSIRNMVVGKPPEEIVDREWEVDKIVGSMINSDANVNYALVGHRRIGKSTILHEVKRRLEKRCMPVYIDLGEYRYSAIDFAEVLTEDLTKAYARTIPKSSKILNKIANSLKQLSEIKRLRARFIATIDDSGQPSIEIDPYVKDRDENHAKALHNAFDYANRISEVSGKRVVIMIDEFQHVVDYKQIADLQNILDLIRAVLERRKNVSFIVSGSRIHYLKNILGEGGSPLFGHFVIIEIKPLFEGYAIELFLKSNPKATKRDAGEAYGLVDGHPFYLVMLAEAQRDNESIGETYRRILTSATGALYLYVNYIITEDLGSNYKNTRYPKVLMSLSDGEKTASEIAKGTSIKLTTLPKILSKLIEFDLVQKNNGKYSIVDKVVRDYFYYQKMAMTSDR